MRKNQKKFHLFKKSLIDNWICENKNWDLKYLNFSNKNNLLKFSIDNIYCEITSSSDREFYIFYDKNDKIRELLNLLEKFLNTKNLEKYIDDLFLLYKDENFISRDISNFCLVFEVLEFWFYRWESILDQNFLLAKDENEKWTQITNKKNSISKHIDSQLFNLYRLKFIEKIELPEWFDTYSPDKWSNSRITWDFNEENSLVYIIKHIFFPLLQNPIFLWKIGEEKFFYFQISPYLTIIVFKKNSTKIIGLLDNINYLIWYMACESKSYCIYFTDDFFIKKCKSEEFQILLNSWINEINERRKTKMLLLNRKSKDKSIFCYNISYLISGFRETSTNSQLNIPTSVYYNSSKRSIIYFDTNEINEYEKKINSICYKQELIDICYKESKKLNEKDVTKKKIIENLSLFNFKNK